VTTREPHDDRMKTSGPAGEATRLRSAPYDATIPRMPSARPALEAQKETPLPTAAGQLSAVDRAARGRAQRTAVLRSAHAELDLPADRPDPLDLLATQDRTRVPDLVPIRYGRMAVTRSRSSAGRPR
jgi:hypothetical protein